MLEFKWFESGSWVDTVRRRMIQAQQCIKHGQWITSLDHMMIYCYTL